MVEDVPFSSASAVKRIVSNRKGLRVACGVRRPGVWHVIGPQGCSTPEGEVCSPHYGFCLPVTIVHPDPRSEYGEQRIDVEALRRTLKDVENILGKGKRALEGDIDRPIRGRKRASSSPAIFSSGNTLADLAAPKRAGLTPSPSPQSKSSTSTIQRDPLNHFSLELMQTDDVSSIAAQIANQAELIYQAWKTTDLNPNELIHYHSIGSERSPSRASPSPLGHRSHTPLSTHASPSFGGFQSGSGSPHATFGGMSGVSSPIPRVPMRSMSPAPPGSSPAVPRRVIEIPISTDNGAAPQQKQPQYHKPQQAAQQQSTVSHQHHASSPVRSLNTSPRPYVSPGGSTEPSPSRSYPQSSPIAVKSTKRAYVRAASQPLPLSTSPPPPPERSSSYVEPTPTSSSSNYDILADPDLETSLRQLVANFVMEDKARHTGGAFAGPHSPQISTSPSSPLTRLSERAKSAPPASIQDALQRFERQMAITSRVASKAGEHTSSVAIPGSTTVSSVTSPINRNATPSPYSPPVSSTLVNNAASTWSGKKEQDARARRSVSPGPPPLVSQPGWNEPPPANTTTWPLKNKAAPGERRASSPQPPPQLSVITSPKTSSHMVNHQPHSPGTKVSAAPTNYITTLEAHVDSPSQKVAVPLRHKVVSVSPSSTPEDERLMKALRKGTLIEDGDRLRPVESISTQSNLSNLSRPKQSSGGGNVTSITGGSSSSVGQSRGPKFSISVTVDMDKKQTNIPTKDVVDNRPITRESTNHVDQLSNVDFAKVRFQDAQQRPRTTQRMEDYKNFTPKSTINGDGRVLNTKTKFEVTGQPISQEVPWRTGHASSHSLMQGEIGSTLPEFYRRKIRKMRKSGSPEPLHALSSLPHPELTDTQKAHIRERSQSPILALANIAVRPYLTQGSVAERVLLFEKAPTEVAKTTAISSLVADKKRPAFSTWRDPDEVRTKAQDAFPSPSLTHGRSLDVSPPSTAIETPTSASLKQGRLPEAVSPPISNKENARPSPTSPSSPTPLSPTSSISSPLHSPISPLLASPSPLSAGAAGPGTPPTPRLQTPNGRRLAKTTKNLLIPRFYFPMGRPTALPGLEAYSQKVSQCFRENGGQIPPESMDALVKACQVPLYWKNPLFIAAGGEKLGYLTHELFSDYWGRVVSSCHDISSRFVRILSRGVRNYLVPEDFLSLVQDVVDTHPGLTFLKEATEFHSRYVHTVIARIYYCVNRSWSGRITIPELRRSNLLQVISYLEEEEDINKITDYFSYEHFYVIYCKFWELDTDHDLFIDRNDLAKHNERALSWRIIERIFSGAVTRGRVQKQDRMGYQEFVWFLISEEDKRHPTAIEYWFRCMDLDGDGYLSMYELEYFYEEQLQRMEALGIETLPFSDCLCQMLDMVRPEEGDKISLRDLKACRLTPVFFDTFFNLEKYLDHEQRDPFASHRMEEEGEVSDWDRYAAEEYELLVAEEGGGDQGEEMLYVDEDELSMGVDDILDSGEDGLDPTLDANLGISLAMGLGIADGNGKDTMGDFGGCLTKHSSLSTTVPNLAIDPMDVDEEYSDYADSDDY